MDNRPDDLVPASRDHARRLAARLAPDHRREVAAAAGVGPDAAVALSLAASLEAYAWLDDAGESAFLMGVEPASALTGGAMVWLLATADAPRCPRALLRAARWGTTRAFAATGAAWLEQFIPAWYDAGLRFALRLGFTAAPGGGPFVRVVNHRKES